ncbi:MAG: hypothetical protein SF339_13890 [Blastocatellia bacterium]|nr:hypothetical protein [Blastocatellia bacterium]
MRTSRRRLLFGIAYCLFALVSLGLSGAMTEAFAQNIAGLPGSAPDAALGRGVSENKLGSVLFFNYYTSDALSSSVNTRISITNANPLQDIAIHVFFVDSATCNVADAFLCLTRNQTTSFAASDLDPNVSGYIVAVAVDSQGRPVSFNYLAGDELVVTPTAHRFGLAAMTAARRDGNFASPINSNGTTATVFFNGSQYDSLPYAMVLDSFPSQVGGVGAPLADTRLYVYSPLPDLTGTGAAFNGTLFFVIRDDQENNFSGQLPLGCYLASDKQRILSVRTTPNLNTIVPAGRTGWATFYGFGNRTILCNPSGATVGLSNVPLMGATATKAGSYTGGHNLRYATTFNAPGYSITIPVFPPGCPTVDFPTQGSALCGD